MRLGTATRADGSMMWGPIVEDVLHDVSVTFSSPADLVAMASTDAGRDEIERAATGDRHPLEEIELLPPVPSPARILCVGINYAEHASETGRSADSSSHPVMFTRFASSLVGHGHPVERPMVSDQLDYEGELAVVIGRTCREVPLDDALEVVSGYSCFMDGSVRDFQFHSSQFTPGKNFDRSGAWGPWIVTADEIGDPSDLELTTTVGGEVLQQASTSQMIHGIAEIVAYCSTFTTLEPGDVIATGTPAGVGAARTPPRFLSPGEEVAVTIERIGTLTNGVVEQAG
jgi:2-keto-4-pentenoate hydratase/2-oxohepta-3-ene-1,7-dioic acid hydratase in catechol pathway